MVGGGRLEHPTQHQAKNNGALVQAQRNSGGSEGDPQLIIRPRHTPGYKLNMLMKPGHKCCMHNYM